MPTDTQAILDSTRRIVRALRLSSRAAEKRCGLSGAQLFVLQRLGEGPAPSLNELAKRTMTHQSSVSVVVRRLIERGLVASSPAKVDARRIELALSASGKRFLRGNPPLAQEKLLAAIEALDAGRRRCLAELLAWVVSKAGLDQEPPSLFLEDDDKGAST